MNKYKIKFIMLFNLAILNQSNIFSIHFDIITAHGYSYVERPWGSV